METCIAVDIGGTKMLIAEVCADGTIVHSKRFPTGKIGKPEVLRQLIAGVREYEEENGWKNGIRPERMGIGINGLIDPINGIWKKLPHEEQEIAVAEQMEREFSVRCFVDNDVKSTVMAENRFGVGKGCRDLVYINVGTGLAAGIIANGKLVRGTDGFAGEVGFMNFTCGEGVRIELMASGMGLDYQTEHLISEYPDSALKQMAGGVVPGAELFTLAEQGDCLAKRILDEMVRMNALLISNLICVLSPEIVILGGGLINSGKLLDRIAEQVLPKAREHLEKGIVLTGFDPANAGLMGAAAIGFGCQQEYF